MYGFDFKMSYFEDVYLKRMNREGVTQQERVKTRKEKEFDMLFLKKTEYQANIYQINEEEATYLFNKGQYKKSLDMLIKELKKIDENLLERLEIEI